MEDCRSGLADLVRKVGRLRSLAEQATALRDLRIWLLPRGEVYFGTIPKKWQFLPQIQDLRRGRPLTAGRIIGIRYPLRKEVQETALRLRARAHQLRLCPEMASEGLAQIEELIRTLDAYSRIS